MEINIKNRSWSAYSDEIHTPEGVARLNEYYKEVEPTWHVELIDGKAVIRTGGQDINL